MALALITGSPATITAIYQGDTANVNVPGKWQIQGAAAGWQSPDGVYRLVAVPAFVPPAGQQAIGAPSYSIDGNGVVTETYATTPIVPSVLVDAATFIGRFSDAEYAAIKSAAVQSMAGGNAQLQKWIDIAEAQGHVDVLSADDQSAKAALVSAGLLTQARADQIFS